jgi:hypothetical protein
MFILLAPCHWDCWRGPSNEPVRSVKNVTERRVYEVGCCCFAWFLTFLSFIVRLWQCYCAGTWELTTACGALVGWWLTRKKVRTREVTSPSAVVSTTNPQIEPRRLLWIAGYCLPWVCWGLTAISQPNKFAGVFEWEFVFESLKLNLVMHDRTHFLAWISTHAHKLDGIFTSD